MANMFDENGNYNKTEWKPGDRITAGKLNKIEESLEAINNNDIERHVEADNRLDILEYNEEVMEDRVEELEDLVADNKTEVEVLIYENNVKMDRLEQEINDGIDTVEAIAHTVDDKIADADASMKAQVAEAEDIVGQGKTDINAIIDEVEKISDLEAINTQLTHIENNSLFSEEITVNTSNELIEAIENDNYTKITLRKGVYNIDGVLEINKHIDGKGSIIEVNSPFTTSSRTKLENISFQTTISKSNNCINLKGGCEIENCIFSLFDTAINQVGICVHGYIKNCTFQYNKNGIWLSCPDTTSMNNFIIENNYFVKQGINADDLSADGTADDMIGIGLYLNGGCNHVVIRENVFEYNTFCGVYAANTSTSKTNDSKIVCNYFEGNKITSIYVKIGDSTNNQLIIRDNFYAPKMTSNSDYIREDIVLRSTNTSFNTIYGKRNIQILGGGMNLEFAADRSYFSFTSKYVNVPFDRIIYSMGSDDVCLVYMRYTTKLNSNVSFRDGTKTDLVLHTFENSDGAFRTAIVSMPKNTNKYISRVLEDDEHIRIYEYRVL